MKKRVQNTAGKSPLWPLILDFVEEKRAYGYKYDTGYSELRRLDEFLFNRGLKTEKLPQDLVREWMKRRPYDRRGTHLNRIGILRGFIDYLRRHGHDVPVIKEVSPLKKEEDFIPHIFSKKELCRIFKKTDQTPNSLHSPLRHRLVPLVFRVLYGCGLRLGEFTNLLISDVDVERGIIRIREGKFNKERLVPVAESLRQRLTDYRKHLPTQIPSQFYPLHFRDEAFVDHS
jgi:integrase/recombinase XerD